MLTMVSIFNICLRIFLSGNNVFRFRLVRYITCENHIYYLNFMKKKCALYFLNNEKFSLLFIDINTKIRRDSDI